MEVLMGAIVYHGNPNLFERFIIDHQLSRYAQPQDLNEGYGVYMTEDYAVASNYGNYVYTIDIHDQILTDFTSASVVMDVLRKLQEQLDITFRLYFNVSDLVRNVVDGSVLLVTLHREIFNQLDSNERFYTEFGHQITYAPGCFSERLESAFYSSIGSVIKYNDPSFDKPLYICFRNPEYLNIVNVHQV
jgi:hypothetical protein